MLVWVSAVGSGFKESSQAVVSQLEMLKVKMDNLERECKIMRDKLEGEELNAQKVCTKYIITKVVYNKRFFSSTIYLTIMRIWLNRHECTTVKTSYTCLTRSIFGAVCGVVTCLNHQPQIKEMHIIPCNAYEAFQTCWSYNLAGFFFKIPVWKSCLKAWAV